MGKAFDLSRLDAGQTANAWHAYMRSITPLLVSSFSIYLADDDGGALGIDDAADAGEEVGAVADGVGASASSSAASARPSSSASHFFKGAFRPVGGDTLLSSELLSIRKLRLARLAELRGEAKAKLQELGETEGPQAVAVRVTYLMKQIDQFTHAARSHAAPQSAEGAGASSGSSSSGAGARGGRRGGKHAMGASDEAEELAAEADSEAPPGATSQRLTEQPKNLTFGKMRDYQIEGLNWMIALHDANMSGILADEMGLGACMAGPSAVGGPRYLVEAGRTATRPRGPVSFYRRCRRPLLSHRTHPVASPPSPLPCLASPLHSLPSSLPPSRRQDPSVHLAAGVPARVPAHRGQAHRAGAQVHAGQLGQGVRAVVPRDPRAARAGGGQGGAGEAGAGAADAGALGRGAHQLRDPGHRGPRLQEVPLVLRHH